MHFPNPVSHAHPNSLRKAVASPNLDGLRIPLPPQWYGNALEACTPLGGIVYLSLSRSRLVHIAAKSAEQPDAVANIQSFQCHNRVIALDCDPDWSDPEAQHIVTMEADNTLCVWNVRQRLVQMSCIDLRHQGHAGSKPFGGHGGHGGRYGKRGGGGGGYDTDRNRGGTMCMLRTRSVLANVGDQFVVWCTASNTSSSFELDAKFVREPIVLLRVAPHDANLVAAGTDRGLCVLLDLAQKRIVHRMRGHDKTITSLDWMRFQVDAPVPEAVPDVPVAAAEVAVETTASAQPDEASPVPASAVERRAPLVAHASTSSPSAAATAREAKLRGQLKPIVESDDVFDIYQYDDDADKFGIVTQPHGCANAAEHEAEAERLRMLSVEEKAVGNDHFDFVEACQNLKEDILQAVSPGGSPAARAERSVGDGEEQEGDTPTRAELSPTLALERLSLNDGETLEVEADASVLDANGKQSAYYLVSGAVEAVVWIWDVTSGAAVQKIELRRMKPMPIPELQTCVCWMDDRTLIVNTPGGEVAAYDVVMGVNRK